MNARPSSFAELVGFPAGTSAVGEGVQDTHATTVLALRFDQGVVMLADRRATAGNLVMFDNAEKILSLDDSTLIAISGSFARSVEIGRFLKHSLKYYRRVTLGELSLQGKLQEISRSLVSNLEMAMSGIGLFLPIVAAYDASADSFGLYFFDGMGARFENHEYACAGSGSERIRGVFEYLSRAKGPWDSRPLADVLKDGMTMLDIAADLDSATGGFSKILPAVKVLDRTGTSQPSEEEIRALAESVLSGQKG
ncbi:MAG: proteasome subunit alpha [Armatimonadetes bacterium]|nr:proteasome subunit alpha [Armatimonadota bacterium]